MTNLDKELKQVDFKLENDRKQLDKKDGPCAFSVYKMVQKGKKSYFPEQLAPEYLLERLFLVK